MKKIKNLNLASFVNKLTRNEMRYVMAGSGSASCKNSFTKCGRSEDAGTCGEYVENKCWCSFPGGRGVEDSNCNGN